MTFRARIEALALAITNEHEEKHPEIFRRFGEVARVRCHEDARFHLQFLAAALEAQSPAMFLDYVAWTKVMLAKRNVSEQDLRENLEITARLLHDDANAQTYLRAAIDELPSMPDDVPSLLDPRAPLWNIASAYLDALLHGSRRGAQQIVTAALDAGTPLRDIYRRVFEPVQQEIGRLWQLNQISVAQEHFCTAATQHIMTQLYGRMFATERTDKRAVAMCVGGELHEVGLRIITDLLELEGWQTWYLGASVPPAAAVQLCVDHRADVLLVSATLPPHLASVAEVIRIFRGRPELAGAKVIVGGRAFQNAAGVWLRIGADAYAANADDLLAHLSA